MLLPRLSFFFRTCHGRKREIEAGAPEFCLVFDALGHPNRSRDFFSAFFFSPTNPEKMTNHAYTQTHARKGTFRASNENVSYLPVCFEITEEPKRKESKGVIIYWRRLQFIQIQSRYRFAYANRTLRKYNKIESVWNEVRAKVRALCVIACTSSSFSCAQDNLWSKFDRL